MPLYLVAWTTSDSTQQLPPNMMIAMLSGKCKAVVACPIVQIKFPTRFFLWLHPSWNFVIWGPNQTKWQQYYLTITSWWFQPIWKILVKLDHFPRWGWEWKMFQTTTLLSTDRHHFLHISSTKNKTGSKRSNKKCVGNWEWV